MKIAFIVSLIFFSFITTCYGNSAERSQFEEPETSLKWRNTWLSAQQREWLSQHKVIQHGLLSTKKHMPFEYTDDLNKHQGVTSDYLKIISEKLGITFQANYRTPEFSELAKALQDNKVNFVSYIPKTAHLAQQIIFTKAIIKMPVVLLGRHDAAIIPSIKSLQNEQVVVQKGSYAHAFLSRNFPYIKVRYVKSTIEGLEALDAKSADIFIHNVFSAEYYQRKLGITGLKVLATTPYNYEIMFAASKEMAPIIPIIEKAIDDISDREKRLIFDKWINIQIEKKIDLKLVFVSIFVGIVIIVIIVMLFSYWNRQLSKKVLERTTELRNLAQYMQQVREDEKAKLAREIHDELGHTLTALTIGIRRLLTTADEKERIEKSNELSVLVKSASQTSKQIMSDLRPSILEDLGIVAALEWLVQEFKSRHGTHCRITAHESQIKLDEEASIAIFRITQESLTNIAKHAQASQVEIILTLQGQELLLLISDNGLGLKAGWATKEGSYGLQGMRERALALGGELTVESKKNQGVQLLVRIPSR